MAREALEKTIDGVDFKFEHLDPYAALRLQSRLIKAIGSNGAALQKMIGSANPSPGDMLGMFGAIPEDELIAIANLLATKAWLRPAGGNAWLLMEPKVIAVHLTGEVLLMWRWIGQAIAFQLADFFGGRPSA